MKRLLTTIIIAVAIAGCDSRRVYEFDQEFKDRTWKTADSTKFEFRIADTSQKYNVYFNVRNSLDYPWERLFIQYTLTDSLKAPLDKKLVTEYLFERSGKPLGRSGLGDVYDHQFPISTNHTFSKAGLYSVRLEQFMRTDTLKGIFAVGVRIEKAAAN